MDKWAAMQGQSVYGTNSQEQSWNINQGQFSDSSDIVCKLNHFLTVNAVNALTC